MVAVRWFEAVGIGADDERGGDSGTVAMTLTLQGGSIGMRYMARILWAWRVKRRARHAKCVSGVTGTRPLAARCYGSNVAGCFGKREDTGRLGGVEELTVVV